MNSEKELMEFVSGCTEIELSTREVGDLRWDYGHYASVPDNDTYDKLSIVEFYNYYKINRLEELGLITLEEKEKLINLYSSYLEINKKIGEESYKRMIDNTYESNSLEELHRKSFELEKLLMEHYINVDGINICQMMDSEIACEYGTNENMIRELR